jgi:hypothetical protein
MTDITSSVQAATDFARKQNGRPDGPQVVRMPARQEAPELVFDGAGQPPFDRFDQLLRDNREFKRAWDHRLPHLPDQSTEAYDRALANIALQAGWNDQEVVDLVIAHRRRQPMEDANPGAAYFLDVLQRAKDGPDAASPADSPDSVDSEDAERVRKLIAALNRALGISILKVVKYGGNDGTYELTLEDGRKVDLGPAGKVLSHKDTKAAIAGATTSVIAPFKQPQWDKIASAIFKCAGPAPIEDAPEQQEMSWWLRSCVREITVVDVDEHDRAGLAEILRKRAGTWAFHSKTGNLLIHLGGFMAAVHLHCGARPTWKECALRLRKIGFMPCDLEGKDAAGKVRVNVWRSPHGWQVDG